MDLFSYQRVLLTSHSFPAQNSTQKRRKNKTSAVAICSLSSFGYIGVNNRTERKFKNQTLDYLEDIRDKKLETNAEAQRLVDEIQKFSQIYIQKIQSHADSLITRVQQNRQAKLSAIEDTIADIERLENETENALDIRYRHFCQNIRTN